jgi:hypothetical protein
MTIRAHSALKGRRILIVESEVALGPALQDALEHEGAETIIVRDPYSSNGAAQLERYAVCAAIVNSVHRGVERVLSVPALLYGGDMPVPARTDAIVHELRAMLANTAESDAAVSVGKARSPR